jgi:hypothetical protein
MEDAIETIQAGAVNFALIRVPPDFARAGRLPD